MITRSRMKLTILSRKRGFIKTRLQHLRKTRAKQVTIKTKYRYYFVFTILIIISALQSIYTPVSDHLIISFGVHALLLAAGVAFFFITSYGSIFMAMVFPRPLQIWICGVLIISILAASAYLITATSGHLHRNYCTETKKPIFMKLNGSCRVRNSQQGYASH